MHRFKLDASNGEGSVRKVVVQDDRRLSVLEHHRDDKAPLASPGRRVVEPDRTICSSHFSATYEGIVVVHIYIPDLGPAVHHRLLTRPKVKAREHHVGFIGHSTQATNTISVPNSGNLRNLLKVDILHE